MYTKLLQFQWTYTFPTNPIYGVCWCVCVPTCGYIIYWVYACKVFYLWQFECLWQLESARFGMCKNFLPQKVVGEDWFEYLTNDLGKCPVSWMLSLRHDFHDKSHVLFSNENIHESTLDLLWNIKKHRFHFRKQEKTLKIKQLMFLELMFSPMHLTKLWYISPS